MRTMIVTALALAALGAASAANAWCYQGEIDTGSACVTPGTSTTNTNTLGQGQTQGQTQGQKQGINGSGNSSASGGQGGTGGSASQQQDQGNGNAQNEITNESFSYPRQTPVAIAPELQATVSCFRPITAAGSTPLFGLAGGGGTIDKDCERRADDADLRETARFLCAAGQLRLCIITLCSIPSEREALGRQCVYQEPPPEVVPESPCAIAHPCEPIIITTPADERVERQKARGFPQVNK